MIDRFLLCIHHGGSFGLIENTPFYAGGNTVTREILEVDTFGYFTLVDEIKKLGYVSWNGISYKVPNTLWFKHIFSDKECNDITNFLSDKQRVINIYVDCGKKEGDELSDEFVDLDDHDEGGNKDGTFLDGNLKSDGGRDKSEEEGRDDSEEEGIEWEMMRVEIWTHRESII